MRSLKLLAFITACLLPVAAFGGLETDDLPAGSVWYLHVDFEEMRSSEAGRGIYAFLEQEAFAEVKRETGVDIGQELGRLTAFATSQSGLIAVLEGKFSQETRDKIMAVSATAEDLDRRDAGRRSYYAVRTDGEINGEDFGIDEVGDELYFSFDIDDRILLTSNEDEMRSLLGNRGRVAGSRGHRGALFVLTAEQSLLQAGMNTEDFDVDGGGFDSNLLKNTRQVAVMIADVAGNVAIEAQLVATEAEAANGLASIVRGLIALASFSDELEPELAEVLRSVRVDVDDLRLKISLAVPPATVAKALNEA